MQALLQPFIMQLVTFVSVKRLRKNDLHTIISRHVQYNDVYTTIEIPQRARMLKANGCLKVHNIHLKLALPISGKVFSVSLC